MNTKPTNSRKALKYLTPEGIGLVDIAIVASMTGQSEQGIRSMVRSGDFIRPQRLKVGVYEADYWAYSEVDEWAERLNAANGQLWRMRDNQAMAAADIAEYLGIPVYVMNKIIRAGQFIAPCGKQSVFHVWAFGRVEEWRKQFYDLREVANTVGVQPGWVLRNIRKKRFPKPAINRKDLKLWAVADVVGYVADSQGGAA